MSGVGIKSVQPFAAAHPATGFVTPLAGKACAAGVLSGLLAGVVRDEDKAFQTGYRNPCHNAHLIDNPLIFIKMRTEISLSTVPSPFKVC
jgi:hypothetical protein